MTETSSRPRSLARLREEIESVDRSLLLLLAARLEAAQRAIRVRSATNRRMTDAQQERRVLERSRRWGRELGLPEPLVENLFRTLIEEGKARFRSAGAPSPSSIVTVCLADPRLPAVSPRGSAKAQPVPAPTLR